MKISITYLYTIFKYGYPPSIEDDFRALAEIESLGFHYLEMEGLGGAHTDEVWRRRRDFRKCLDDHGIQVHNFCGVDPELVALDPATRGRALERFKRTAELGVYLGASTLHVASYAPPIEYLGQAPYQIGRKYAFGDTFRVRVPGDFRWDRVWGALVESCRETARIAAGYGRTIIMEPRVGETICSVDSLLRLIGDVGMPNFKANFDTGHFSAQRENVVLALCKLEGQYANIHLSDNNPANTDHLPLGEGLIDWPEFFRILKRQGYDGYLGLDLGGRPGLVADYRTCVDRLQTIAAELGIRMEL